MATAGTSPKLSPTSLRKSGVAVRFVLSELILVHLEGCGMTESRGC